MMDRGNARRQGAARERERAAGLVRVTVVIPEDKRAEHAALVKRWRDAAETLHSDVAGD